MTDEQSHFTDLSNYITVKEAATMLGISVKRVYRYVEEGRLAAFKPGRDYMIPKEAVRQFKLKNAGRPREKTPAWRIFRGAALLKIDIRVQVRSGQQERLTEKLHLLCTEQRHTFPGTIQRFIWKDTGTPATIEISLVWKSTEMPDEETRTDALAAFKAELADVLDWDTAQYRTKEGIIYT